MSFLGKRLCPGETFSRQNMFMYVAGLLQNFTFSAPEGSKLPDDNDFIPGLNTHPKHFWMKVTPREPTDETNATLQDSGPSDLECLSCDGKESSPKEKILPAEIAC